MFLAFIIIVVILIIWWAPKWNFMDNKIYAWAKSNNGDGKLLGSTDSHMACAMLCNHSPDCNFFSYNKDVKMCMGSKNNADLSDMQGIISGARTQIGTFSNTLQRRMGMESAGANTAAKESLRTATCTNAIDCAADYN